MPVPKGCVLTGRIVCFDCTFVTVAETAGRSVVGAATALHLEVLLRTQPLQDLDVCGLVLEVLSGGCAP